MNLKFYAPKLALLFITIVFFGCKEQLFDGPVAATPTAVVTPVPEAGTTPAIDWWLDVSEVALPISDGKPVNPAFIKGNTDPTIVILGSATAEGVGASTKSKSWVELMKAKLKNDNKNVRVVNLGTKKFTTYHIMPTGNKVANRPLSKLGLNISRALELKPFLVIIHLTTTDISSGFTEEETLKNYAALRQKLISARINYLFTGTQPRNLSLADRNRLVKLNDKLRAMDPDHFVDVLNKLSKKDYNIKKVYAYKDGRNITDPGHAVINGYIFNAPLFKQLVGYK
jgi:acyl-CoA thioesterase-1